MTKTDKYSFLYVLDYLEDTIRFNVIRRDLQTNEIEVSGFEMNPLTKQDMEELFRGSSFQNWKFYKENTFSAFDVEQDTRYNIIATKDASKEL